MWCYCQSSLLIRSLSGCLSYIFIASIHFWQRITAVWNANSGHFKGLRTTTLIPLPSKLCKQIHMYTSTASAFTGVYTKYYVLCWLAISTNLQTQTNNHSHNNHTRKLYQTSTTTALKQMVPYFKYGEKSEISVHLKCHISECLFWKIWSQSG